MRRIIFIGAASAGAMIMTAAAEAQTAGAFMINPAFQGLRPARCISTAEMQRCAAVDLRSADAQMRSRYSALNARLRPAAKQALLSEQRAWLRSRDSNCLAKGRGGGSMASVNVAQCWVEKTKARARALSVRLSRGSTVSVIPASTFVGRWRGGEGTYMKIARQGAGFLIDNQWGLDEATHGIFKGTITTEGLRFRRDGVAVTVKPSAGAKINRSALRGKIDCLKVSDDEGYCRY